MWLSKEEMNSVVERVLNGDQEAFELFYDNTYRIVYKFAGKWLPFVKVLTRNMYDFEDICQDVWYHVIHNLHSYDPEKGSLTTWLYATCKSGCQRIQYYWDRDIRREYDPEDIGDDDAMQGENRKFIYLNGYAKDDSDTELGALIPDTMAIRPDKILEDFVIYDYIYVMKLLIEMLDARQRQVYIHMIKGLTLEDSSRFFGITRERTRQIRVKVTRKHELLMKNYNAERINTKDAAHFSTILLSELSDDSVVDLYHYDLATVKICRQALEAAGLY